MKKFQFPFERILRYHQQRLKQAELRLSQAAMERTAAQNAVLDCQQQIDRACQISETVGGLINPTIRSNLATLVERLSKTLAVLRDRLKAAELRFRETEQVCAEITREVEGFQQLRNLRREEHHNEVMRQQQIELDEVVMRKWSVRLADDPALPTGTRE